MDHSPYEIMIQLYIDQCLPPEQLPELTVHLADCPECKQLWRDLSQLDALLEEELTEVEPPEDLCQKVMSALPEPANAAAPRKPRVWAWASSLAAALLVGLGLMGLGGHQVLERPPLVLPVAEEEPPARPDLSLPQAPVVAEADPTDEAEAEEPAEAGADGAVDKKDGGRNSSHNDKGGNDAPSHQETYSGEWDLPSVAASSQAHGAYSLITLASAEGCSALRPQVVGSNVNFYIQMDDSYLQWQVPADGSASPVCLGESSLPGRPGQGRSGQSEDGSQWYEASSPDGTYSARNTASGLLVNEQQASASGGGSLVCWSPDSSKVFFSDASGRLYLYYPVEGCVLDICSGVNSAAWYGSGYIVMSAYDSASGFYSIFRVTVP